MHYSEDDNRIIENESATQKDTAYPKYIQQRFLVIETHETPEGYCAQIADKETGTTQKYYQGDDLADGTIGAIEPDGIVAFKPPRAEIQEFTLPSEQEMSPIGGHKASKGREKKDEELKGKHGSGAVVVISIDDEMERASAY